MSDLTITFQPTIKQDQAWQYLTNQTTTELLFGGGAGGAKSYLGCAWLILNCLRYTGSRWLMGRAVLKTLKGTTLITFFQVATSWGLKANHHFVYNQQDGTITFWNASVIDLKDLFLYPSDPNFDALGSSEYTGAFIDEANQVSFKAKEVVRTRCRFKLTEFQLIPKLLLTCNPSKNWAYADFYLPWKRGTLPQDRAFVQALVTDNPHISPDYIKSLRNLKDKALKERLLFGNWEYDDDPNALFARDDLHDLFSNPVEPGEERYLICDVARFGRDKTVYSIWHGLVEVERVRVDQTATTDVVADIEGLRTKYGIPQSHCLVDEGGVGGGVVDQGKYKGFIGNAAAMQNAVEAKHTYKVNYANLRSQCGYTLADYVREHKIRIECEDETVQQLIIGDLEQIKSKDPDKDSKLRIVGKDEIKEHLGRSPDDGDTLMMRMFFELDPTPVLRIR